MLLFELLDAQCLLLELLDPLLPELFLAQIDILYSAVATQSLELKSGKVLYFRVAVASKSSNAMLNPGVTPDREFVDPTVEVSVGTTVTFALSLKWKIKFWRKISLAPWLLIL